MGICRDEATTYLQRWGYNVVRHPREGLAPLSVISRQHGVTSQLGRLDQLVSSPGVLPELQRDLVAQDINGQRTGSLHVGVGLSVLKSVLSALGGGGEVSAAYDGAHALRIAFANVLTDIVQPLDISRFLNAQVLASDPLLDQYAFGDGQLYVVTQTLKSNQITVTATAKDGSELAVKVPELQAAVGASVSVKSAVEGSHSLTYAGDRYLVFGFRCFEIGIDGGKFQLFASAPGGAMAMASGASGDRDGAILATDRLVSFG